MDQATKSDSTLSMKYRGSDILSGSINSISFSPDGRLLVLTDSRGSLAAFDAASATPVAVGYLIPHSQALCHTWASNHELFIGCSDGLVASIVFKRTGNKYCAQIGRYLNSFPDYVMCLAYSNKPSPYLAVGMKTRIEVWSFDKVRSTWSKANSAGIDDSGSSDFISSVAFIPNTCHILVGCYRQGIYAWDPLERTRALVPGLPEKKLVQSFLVSTEGLVMVAFGGHGTGLYRLSAKTPYGFTTVLRWPGDSWRDSPQPTPYSLSSYGKTHFVTCATHPNEVIYFEIDGLGEQFAPALPEAWDPRTFKLRTGRKIVASSGFIGQRQLAVALAYQNRSVDQIELEVWTSSPNQAKIARKTRQEFSIYIFNLSELIYWRARQDRPLMTAVVGIAWICICVLLFGAARWLWNFPNQSWWGSWRMLPVVLVDAARKLASGMLVRSVKFACSWDLFEGTSDLCKSFTLLATAEMPLPPAAVPTLKVVVLTTAGASSPGQA